MKIHHFLFICFAGILAASCSNPPADVTAGCLPDIYPDYAGITVPRNIAALNFVYRGEGKAVLQINGDRTIRAGRDGCFRFGKRLWRQLLEQNDTLKLRISSKSGGKWTSYRDFEIFISPDPIDPCVSYRLIPPGYQGWKDMGIYERCLENFSQRVIHNNANSGENCVNCHSYCNRNPGKMTMHLRADFGGTVLFDGGKSLKLDTKTDSTISALVYPYWHPDGRHIAFSVNSTRQCFFAHNPNRVEVFDSASDIVILDTETLTLNWSPLVKSPAFCETFPCFSPDGKYLYFCSAPAPESMPRDYEKVKYALYRVGYDSATGTFGDELEPVCDFTGEGMSISFPRISPDGRFLVFTRHGYGNFSIWHKDADLWILDLENGQCRSLAALNSDDVESYHCWSSNGRWLIFSSRRDDGLYTRLYIAHIDCNGKPEKAFLLPQKNPEKYYQELMYSYNIPELTTATVPVSKRRMLRTVRETGDAVKKVGY